MAVDYAELARVCQILIPESERELRVAAGNCIESIRFAAPELNREHFNRFLTVLGSRYPDDSAAFKKSPWWVKCIALLVSADGASNTAAEARGLLDAADQQIGGHDIPQSACTALEFCLYTLEQRGARFKNGRTALYWHLIAVLSSHVEI